MTIGTGIVVSIGMLCVTFLIVLGVGVNMNNKKMKMFQNIKQKPNK